MTLAAYTHCATCEHLVLPDHATRCEGGCAWLVCGMCRGRPCEHSGRPCQTCGGAGELLHMWERPGGPPGNGMAPCPDCSRDGVGNDAAQRGGGDAVTVLDAHGRAMNPTDPETCEHPNATHFDEERARGLSASEVRRRFPRGNRCPDCGKRGIFYAGAAHYVAGDW